MMRCAIYTRKSTEEGVGQAFNSLEAQREAAEAYIVSQQAEGWQALAQRYDDGGYTGANLERPALQRLLRDVDGGGVDAVVVHKVDRLTRSLLDFARMMEKFEQRGVSLVSVTQPLNTTTSLGRLTLHILLSFAEFERELIAERTRDKMGAARRKGKWVGGVPVLGYDVDAGGGRLVVNQTEAQQVRTIFQLYAERGCLGPVLEQIQSRQWRTKQWVSRAGRRYEGRPFSRARLRHLLSNIIYIGQIGYGEQRYAGEQAALVEPRLWERVQKLLEAERLSWATSSGKRRSPAQPVGGGQAEAPKRGVTAVRQASAEIPVPRITRLLALAVKCESWLREGVAKDYAELARRGQVSRARITQIMNLLNLAPDIQAHILGMSGVNRREGLQESTVRQLCGMVLWSEQWQHWQQIQARRIARGTG